MGRHLQRGHALFDLKRYREAVEAFQAELAENSDNAAVHAVMAAALVNLRKAREADKAIRRALELAPDMAYAHYILSFVHQCGGALDEAAKAISEAVRLEQSPTYFQRWAVIAEQRGKCEEALAATGQALQLDPWHNPSILLRGKLLARQGKLDEAHALYVTALSRNPEDAATQHALGSLQLRIGNAGTALDMLREARRLDPIGTNDPKAISLAYGRLIWPLSAINQIIFHWHLLSLKKRSLLFTMLAVLLVIGARASGVYALDSGIPGPIWSGICVIVANYLVLPFSLDQLATTVGYFALRREFRVRWHGLLLQPVVLLPAIWAHLCATFFGLMITMPTLAIMVCLGVASFPLCWAGIRTRERGATDWICLPLYILVMVVGAFGAIFLFLDSIVGLLILAAVFAVAYFSDDIIQWSTPSQRRHALDFINAPE